MARPLSQIHFEQAALWKRVYDEDAKTDGEKQYALERFMENWEGYVRAIKSMEVV